MIRIRGIGAFLAMGAFGVGTLLAAPVVAQEAGAQGGGQVGGASQSEAKLPAVRRPDQVGAVQELARRNTERVQNRLQELGLYQGDIDGLWGPQTSQAVAEFQRSHGLAATGSLNVATLTALDQAGNNEPAAQNEQAQGNQTPAQQGRRFPTAQNGRSQATSSYAARQGALTRSARGYAVEGNPVPAVLGPGSVTSNGSVTGSGSVTGGGSVTSGGIPTGSGVTTAVPGAGEGFFGLNANLSNGYNAAVGNR